MLEATAKARLTLMTAATTAPALSTTADGDVETLLDIWVVTAPSSEGASDGEWAMNRAAAEGWRWKAGRGSDRMDFGADGRNFKASQPPEFCLKMAAYYDKLADEAAEPEVPGGTSQSDMELIEVEVGTTQEVTS